MSKLEELRVMSQKERMLWIAGAKVKELNAILKEQGIKGYSKMKKAEKLEMVIDIILAVEEVKTVESVEESNKVTVDKEVLENTMSEIKYLAKPLVNKYNRIIKLEERKYELTKRYPEGNIWGLQKCIKECEKLESINELNDDFFYSFEMICNSMEDWLDKFITEKEKYFYCRELKAKEEATEENNDTTSVPEGTFAEDVDFKVEKTPAKRRAYF